jgi:hypothetical protein
MQYMFLDWLIFWSMKYFFEIENWQKYFGFIFKQGNNASTTSMHPTPLEISLHRKTVQMRNTPCHHMSCTEIELFLFTVHFTLYRRATRHVLTSAAPRYSYITAQYTVHSTDEQHAKSSHELHHYRAISLKSTMYNIQTRNTSCPHIICTEIEIFHGTVQCTDVQHAMSSNELHRDRGFSPYSTLYNVETNNTQCPHICCAEIKLFHCTVHCTMYRRTTRHHLTRVAQR